MYTRRVSNTEKGKVKKLSRIFQTEKREESVIVICINGVSIALSVWLIASYIDVLMNNANTGVYAWWNLIELLF